MLDKNSRIEIPKEQDGYKKLVSNKADLREYVKRKTWFIPYILVPLALTS